MKKIYAVLALSTLALSACSAGGQAGTPAAPSSSSATAKATPTPTPTVLTVPEAGTYYLNAVCPSNLLADKANKVLQAKPLDLAAARKATAALRDGYRKTIERLSDPKVRWPESVKTDAAVLADNMYEELSNAANVASQTTEANLIAAWNAWESSPNTTAQKIRVKLNLPSDTSGSCTAK